MDEWNLFEAAVECFSFCQNAIAPLVVLHLFLQRLRDEGRSTPKAQRQLEQQVLAWLSLPRPPKLVMRSDFYKWFVAGRGRCRNQTITKVRALRSHAFQHTRIRRGAQPLASLDIISAG